VNAVATERPQAPAALAVADAADGSRMLILSGRLDSYSIAGVWREARAAVEAAPDRRIVIDAAAVDYCDGGGVAMLVDLLRQPRAGAAPISIRGLKPQFRTLLDQFDPRAFEAPPEPPPRPTSTVEAAPAAPRRRADRTGRAAS